MSSRPAEQINPTSQYLDEVGRFELLTAEDEVELAKCMETGKEAEGRLEELNGDCAEQEKRALTEAILAGQVARERFINSNLRLVVANARKYMYKTSKLEFNDLVQEGNIGLQRAVDKFDWRRGFKFSTYATWWIKQAIQRGIAGQNRTIRLSATLESQIDTLLWAQRKFISRVGREPTTKELSEESGFSEDQVENTLDVFDTLGDVTSYDSFLSDEKKSARRIDLIQDNQVDVEAEAISELVEQGILEIADDCLNEREKQVVLMRYGIGGAEIQTLEEIGEKLNVTKERIRQIEGVAIFKLRPKLIENGIY